MRQAAVADLLWQVDRGVPFAELEVEMLRRFAGEPLDAVEVDVLLTRALWASEQEDATLDGAQQAALDRFHELSGARGFKLRIADLGPAAGLAPGADAPTVLLLGEADGTGEAANLAASAGDESVPRFPEVEPPNDLCAGAR